MPYAGSPPTMRAILDDMGRRRAPRAEPGPVQQPRDYTQLPERVRPEEMVTTVDVDPGPDPQGGRDTETEFMLRNAGF
jgi:hypothetical protein